MKRLIKKSNSNFEEVEDFFKEWNINWESMDNAKVEKFINENNDCKYDGEAFRVVAFNQEKMNDIFYSLEGNVIDSDEFHNIIKDYIEIKDKYQSFSQTEEGVLEYSSKYGPERFGSSFYILIKANISGLNLAELMEKYIDDLYEPYQYDFTQTKEIIALNNSFSVIGVVVNDEIFKNYQVEIENYAPVIL